VVAALALAGAVGCGAPSTASAGAKAAGAEAANAAVAARVAASARPASGVAAAVHGGATWNGKSFASGVLRTPPHSFQAVTVSGVSCASPVACVAVGDYSYGVTAMPSASARDKVLAEQWNGSKWRVSLLPLPPGDNHSARLNGVSCASRSACAAVGVSGNGTSYAEVYASGKWRLSATVNPV
jgi:hypothetical protein